MFRQVSRDRLTKKGGSLDVELSASYSDDIHRAG
jgi:hypothetical protein